MREYLIVAALVVLDAALATVCVRQRRRSTGYRLAVLDAREEQIRAHGKRVDGLLADMERCHREAADLRAALRTASAECARLVDERAGMAKEAAGAALVLMKALSDEKAGRAADVRALTSSSSPMFDALFAEGPDEVEATGPKLVAVRAEVAG